MRLKRQIMLLAGLLAATCLAGAANAGAPTQFLLKANSGGELQIGTGLPLPIGPQGIFQGGKVLPSAGVFPPLLVPPVPGITATAGTGTTLAISQTLGTGQGGALVVPAGVLSRPAPGTPVPIAVFTTNPSLFQVATTISYAWPAAAATLAPGGAPGPAVLGTGLAGGVITYSGGTKSFGGPAQFAINAGPGAAGGRVPANTMGALPVASVWINAFAGLPTTATMIGLAGASAPAGLAQPGAPVASPVGTTMFGPVASGIGLINQTVGGPAMVTCCAVTPMGGIASSIAVAAPFPSNMVTGSKGFPWTTGLITVSQPAASPPEIFFLSGSDGRATAPVAGRGNISLVSGALSVRALSGPNANRGWLRLGLLEVPEPMALAGLAGALGMLGVCHTVVRRRSN